jgi:endogenous inhibitor of DNA gyrase (YacG/DUF329 family)
MNVQEAKNLILKEFITNSGRLNSSATVVRKYNSYTNELASLISAESHLTIATILYCIVNEIQPKPCLNCGKQLNVYRFSSGYNGKGSTYCSQKCSAEHKHDKNDGPLFTDYSKLLDKNGKFDAQKIDKHMNFTSIEHLKKLTNLETDHVTTLLYSILYGSFKLRYCKECGAIIKFNSNYEYRQFCSKTCRNKNEDFKLNLKENNLARVKSDQYKNTVGLPWFETKVQKILVEQNISTLQTYDDVIAIPRQSSYFNFRCNTCSYDFKARFIYTPICKKCNPNSKPQQALSDYIESLGFRTIVNDRKILKDRKELDIVVPELNLAIEYDGLYWHRNKDDYYKYEECKSLGIRLIKIFDDEDEDIVKSRLAAILGKTENKIFARKCKVIELSNNVYTDFMKTNHIQGTVGASKKYGLEYDSKIVAVMSFGKCRYNATYEWELLRFANVLNTSVIGGASKLFSHFIEENNPKSVLSYCDVRWGTGKMYENLGFEFSHKTEKNYYYMKSIRESRVKYQKHKLKKLFPNADMSKSESEIMKEQGFAKIYDFGNYVYNWNK